MDCGVFRFGEGCNSIIRISIDDGVCIFFFFYPVFLFSNLGVGKRLGRSLRYLRLILRALFRLAGGVGAVIGLESKLLVGIVIPA